MNDEKLYRLNQWQTAVIVAGFICTILGGAVALAKGWLNLPEKVNALEQFNSTNSALMLTIPTRVDALERAQATMWQKRSEDHDLLVRMSQSLDDIKSQSAETRQDVKDLHNKAIK